MRSLVDDLEQTVILVVEGSMAVGDGEGAVHVDGAAVGGAAVGYLLYESDKHHVTLNNAIIFLKKYLNLMKLRYSDNVTVNLSLPDNASEDIVLAPLVFIPFVENAFKHGVALDKPSAINISIEKKDGRLIFHCHNTKSHAKHEYGGVGLRV